MQFIDEEIRVAALIERVTGMSVEEIKQVDTDEIHRSIETKIGRKLKLGFEPGSISSGDVLIDMNRIIWPYDYDGYPYLSSDFKEPNPDEVTRKGSIWTTITPFVWEVSVMDEKKSWSWSDEELPLPFVRCRGGIYITSPRACPHFWRLPQLKQLEGKIIHGRESYGTSRSESVASAARIRRLG